MNLLHHWLCRSRRWMSAVEQRQLPWALNGVELGPSVLEIGPGAGAATTPLRGRVGRLTCIELEHQWATAVASQPARCEVTVVRGDAASMPFAAATFDAAVSMHVLHHLPSRELQDRLFRGVVRVLRPHGWFVGVDLRPGVLARLAHMRDTFVPLDTATLEARLVLAGFSFARITVEARALRFQARRGASSATPERATHRSP